MFSLTFLLLVYVFCLFSFLLFFRSLLHSTIFLHTFFSVSFLSLSWSLVISSLLSDSIYMSDASHLQLLQYLSPVELATSKVSGVANLAILFRSSSYILTLYHTIFRLPAFEPSQVSSTVLHDTTRDLSIETNTTLAYRSNWFLLCPCGISLSLPY